VIMRSFQSKYGTGMNRAEYARGRGHMGYRRQDLTERSTGRIFAYVFVLAVAAVALVELPARAQEAAGAKSIRISDAGESGRSPLDRRKRPAQVVAAERFLAERGWTRERARKLSQALTGGVAAARTNLQSNLTTLSSPVAKSSTAGSATWQSIGPAAVTTSNYGLVSGRVSALALDPSDATGNRLYVGTTGGGVWLATNAGSATASNVLFIPLTDSLSALSSVRDASISIGAVTVQPGGSCASGGSGVILAGTGDPNDAMDSYYGAGILRSTNCGATWSLIQNTADQSKSFAGEGFAGFAWSTATPGVVVAAVSQAYEGTLVNAEIAGNSYEGLYYSTDSGESWTMATITDGSGADVQGPNDAFAYPHGNAATAVVWNPVRQVFVAAVRYHGYYESADGITFTRMSAQPGTNLTTVLCPTNPGTTGSEVCPIYRGALAVNPVSGDTFAWTVDLFNQNQGLWRDVCGMGSGSSCASTSISFGTQLNTAVLERDETGLGPATIVNGDYSLALAAVPTALNAGADTVLLAGANDLWRCSLAMGCQWRNTTNSTTCMSAQVGEYQHALAWNAANPLEIFAGNDSGLWRSTDLVGETGTVCNAADATHFQNLNGGLGSLAESMSLAQQSATPYELITGLGVNGSAGVKDTVQPSGDWPQILSGEGGPVAIDGSSDYWYVNSGAGVHIQRCSASSGACTASDFGTAAMVDMNRPYEDGSTMTVPAPFIVDPLDSSQLLVGTCRLWRVAGDGTGWSATDAVSPILDSKSAAYCSGDAQIRSIAALALPASAVLPEGGEVVYVGMYGAENAGQGSSPLPGHVLSAVFDPTSATLPVWTDLTLNAVSNDTKAMNALGLDISSIYVDPHDATGQTVYVTVEGNSLPLAVVQPVYRSTDGGVTWTAIKSNLPSAPVSSLVVDPQDANTVYVATDRGVYSTRSVATCATALSSCWSAFGVGLPLAPVVALSASSATATAQLLTAATYGRGLWQTPLWTANQTLTAASVTPGSLTFASQAYGTTSAAQAVTLTNTGSYALSVTSIAMSGDFAESDNCVSVAVSAGASCTIQVTFRPSAQGALTGQMAIYGNLSSGSVTLALSGTGTSSSAVYVTPVTIAFGGVSVGATSSAMPVTVNNGTATALSYTSAITGPFAIATNNCVNASTGTAQLAAQSSCQLKITFSPTLAGAATGVLTMSDVAGTQTVMLNGTGLAAATDTLSATSLSFPATVAGQSSAAKTVTLTNSGGVSLTSISASASAPFTATNNCSGALGANSSCSISVVFQPTAAGAAAGTLTVADSLKTQTVSLAGTGVAVGVLSVSPASMNFAAQSVASTSAAQTLTVTNSGGSSLANVSFLITGTSAGSFSLGTTTCGATLASGASCTAAVKFSPLTSDGATAALVVSSSTTGVAAVLVPLTGNSATVPASITVTPGTISFNSVGINQTSAATTVTISNPGTVESLSELSLSVGSGFALVNNTCATTLAAQLSCTAAVVFEPTGTGALAGSLTVASSTVSTAATVTLAGTGTDFSVAPAGTASQTVAAGQTASYTLTISPVGGAQASYGLQCGTLPSYALCVFSPGTTTISGSATGSETVKISTGKSTTSMLRRREGDGRALALLCGVLALPLLWRRRSKLLLSAALMVILVGGAVSCGGSGEGSFSSGSGSGGSSGSGTTPAGTYSIPVTVTSNGVQHSVTLTLIVD
jgi:hypothetical protein